MEPNVRRGRRWPWLAVGALAMLFVTVAGIGGGLMIAAPLAREWLADVQTGAGRTLAALEAADAAPATGAAGSTEAASAPPIDAADAMSVVAAQEQVLEGVYTQVLPSVVHLRVTQRAGAADAQPFQFQMPDIPGMPNPFGGPDGQSPFGLPGGQGPQVQRGEGSGFVWDADGHIVTNNHVVDGADKVVVVFADGTEATATVVGNDPGADLAVVKVAAPAGQLRPIEIGDSDAVKVGQMAIAIGNPFGLANTMTYGIVSAVGRTIGSGATPYSIPEVIQTDAPINPGNSGGPLLDRRGRVIGINSQIISRTGANAGIGFAVPINIAKRVVPALIAGGDYDYAWLGISGQTLTAEAGEAAGLPAGTRGALVAAVVSGGPADKAGLKGSDRQVADGATGDPLAVGGDVIVGIDGQAIEGMDDMIAYLTRETRPGDRVTLDVVRAGGERRQVTVTLEARPDTVDTPQSFQGRP